MTQEAGRDEQHRRRRARGRASAPRRYGWRGLVGFNLLSGDRARDRGLRDRASWIGRRIGTHLDFVAATDQNDVALLLGYVFAVVGWLDRPRLPQLPVRAHRRTSVRAARRASTDRIGRYFRMTTDHKVVGLQYLVGIGAFFFIGGLNAMLIRAELLQPDSHAVPARPVPDDRHAARHDDDHDDVVGDPRAVRQLLRAAHDRRQGHGVPAHRVADVLAASDGRGDPALGRRSSAASRRAGPGYPSLADQAQMGMDSYIVAFALIAISLILVGINMIATIVNMRAPGLTWDSACRSSSGACSPPRADGHGRADADLGPPHGGARPHREHVVLPAPRRAAARSCTRTSSGSSGTPRSTSSRCPASVWCSRSCPVFARKPLWGYRLAVAGMLGVSLLSFMVWQHHLFVSGINSRPAAVLHVHDRADLGAHRVHLPRRDGDDLARPHPLHGADAVLARVLLQLPDRRYLGRLPVRRAERRDACTGATS